MAITNRQLVDIGFAEKRKPNSLEKTHMLTLAEDGVIYAQFIKDKDRIKCWTIDNPKETEFIFLEHLTVKALDLYISRTARRIRKYKNNQDYIKQLLDGID